MICGKIWFFCSLAGFVWESKEREWQDRRGFGNQDACHGCRRNPRGSVRSVPERMQRESGNAKTGRTGGMGAGSGVDVVGSYSSGGSSGTAGAQKTAASAAGSTAPVTPATLATRTAKKTAHTFKEYIQGVNQAAQQAIGEERAKLEDSKQQNAQVGDLPSFVKYVGATIGSVVLAGAAMVMQLAAALLTVLVTMLAFLLVAVLAISLIVSVIMSLIGGFRPDSRPPDMDCRPLLPRI